MICLKTCFRKQLQYLGRAFCLLISAFGKEEREKPLLKRLLKSRQKPKILLHILFRVFCPFRQVLLAVKNRGEEACNGKIYCLIGMFIKESGKTL